MQINNDLRDVRHLFLTRKTHAGTLRETWKPGMLLLDFDKCAPRFLFLFHKLRRLGLHPESMYYAHSSSLIHWHVVIYLWEKLTIFQTLFVQLYLGSDPERELCNFIRAYQYNRTDPFVQILFERKLSEKEMRKLCA